MQTAVKHEGTSATEVVCLMDNFYRDRFRLILLSLAMVVGAIALLIVVSLYFFMHQVLPVTFGVYPEWRVQMDVPVDRAYPALPDMFQWVSTVIPKIFATDFINYGQSFKALTPYFSENGWAIYMGIVKTYMNQEDIVKNKQFVTALAAGAPVILNQGIVEGKYAWWVQMPIEVRYSGIDANVHTVNLVVQALVARVSTVNNLDGVVIDNMIIKTS